MANKTKNKFGAAMFDSIKAALNKGNESSGQFTNIMKFPAGHTYTLRLIPNVDDPKKTFYHHWVHGWNSEATGTYMSYIGLQTFNERDPINELRWKLFKEWREANPGVDNKEYKGAIQQKEQWLVNVYVIDDPNAPENNGTVKILRMGPQLKEIIDAALEGVRADELGYDIFDLTKPHDFKIVAEKSGQFTTFKSSFFTTKSKTEFTEEEIDEIHGSIHDLEQIYPIKTAEELEEILNEHFFVGKEKEDRKPLSKIKKDKSEKKQPIKSEEDEEDEIPMVHSTDKKKTKAASKTDGEDEDYDEELESLMSELDS